MYINHPCQGCDSAPTASACGIRDMNWELSVVDCGDHVHCRKAMQLEDQSRDLGMETPFCDYWLIWSGQAVCFDIETAWNNCPVIVATGIGPLLNTEGSEAVFSLLVDTC